MNKKTKKILLVGLVVSIFLNAIYTIFSVLGSGGYDISAIYWMPFQLVISLIFSLIYSIFIWFISRIKIKFLLFFIIISWVVSFVQLIFLAPYFANQMGEYTATLTNKERGNNKAYVELGQNKKMYFENWKRSNLKPKSKRKININFKYKGQNFITYTQMIDSLKPYLISYIGDNYYLPKHILFQPGGDYYYGLWFENGKLSFIKKLSGWVSVEIPIKNKQVAIQNESGQYKIYPLLPSSKVIRLRAYYEDDLKWKSTGVWYRDNNHNRVVNTGKWMLK